MRKKLLCLSLLFPGFSQPVHAAQTGITPATQCRMITRHVPDADVTYRPGQDVVKGAPVPPADLDGSASAITVPQNFDIEIDAVPGGPVTGPAQAPPLYEPRAKIGRVQVRELEGDTALDFNGQPLTRQSAGEPSPECRQ